MLDALAEHGVDGTTVRGVEGACFGTQFHHILPEDDFDRQPYVSRAGQLLLAADVRFDNREEFARQLGIEPASLSHVSDAELLLKGWEKWGLSITDKLLGDMAFAVWESHDERLTLARTPLSSRPLFFHADPEITAFGSLPWAVLAVPGMKRAPDLQQFANMAAGGYFLPGSNSFFEGIESVPQGEAVVIQRGQRQRVKLWSLGDQPVQLSVQQAGEAIRAQLDRAAAAQTRRRRGGISCHLSAGRDSSAVAAAVSKVSTDQDGPVLALTAAPRAGFADDGLAGSDLSDESNSAAATAAKAGLEHIVIRSRKTALSTLLDRVSRSHFQPFGNPVNLPWIANVADYSAQHSTILMSGAAGNFTISLGGPAFLADYWRDRGLGRWWAMTRRLGTGLSWRNRLSYSFGALIPRPVYAGAYLVTRRRPEDWDSLPLLRGEFRRLAESLRKERMADVRPAPRRRRQFARILQSIEPGDKYSRPVWGIEMRDPTADRRLAQLCYSLPVEAYYDSSRLRPVYEVAFADRLPKAMLENRRGGYQAADWFETVDVDDLRSAMDRYGRNPLVAEIFDLQAVQDRISAWPKQDSPRAYEEYCNQLLGVISICSFIEAHFPG